MKKRLDLLLVERGLAPTRTKAQAMIMAGVVVVAGHAVSKAGEMIDPEVQIEITQVSPYVSRGADKLTGAADAFSLDFDNAIVADIGSSTGGFTDYALQHGAKKVYAVDVGTGQLAWRLRNDERVTVMEKTHIKDVASLSDQINMWLVDVSFISLKKVLPEIQRIAYSGQRLDEPRQHLSAQRYPLNAVVLFKPQFEAGKAIVDKTKGVITDSAIHGQLREDFEHWCAENGWNIAGTTPSPIVGDKGNQEFFYYLQK